MAALARAAQVIGGAARHHLFAEADEGCQKAAQGERFGLATVQRQHVAPKRGLHGRKAVQLVQHHIGRGIAFQLDHHAHAVTIGFVLHMSDALDALFTHFGGDLFYHGGLVHLIGDFRNNDGIAIAAQLFYMCAGAQDHAAAPLEIGFARARAAQHDATCGKIGARHIGNQLFRA